MFLSFKHLHFDVSSAVLFTLAKQAKLLQANKLCLVVNKRLQSLKPPAGVQEQIDVSLCFSIYLTQLYRSYLFCFQTLYFIW